MSERALDTPVLRAEAGASASRRFERLFVREYGWVWRTLRRFGVEAGNVDDAAQQVFLVTSARLDDVPEGRDRAFLIGVMLRVAANARRAHRRRREDEEDTNARATSAANPEQLVDAKQKREQLDRWLDGLPDVLRTPFVLFELEGMTTTEIADLLGLPVGTVKTRLRRARDRFFEIAGIPGGERP